MNNYGSNCIELQQIIMMNNLFNVYVVSISYLLQGKLNYTSGYFKTTINFCLNEKGSVKRTNLRILNPPLLQKPNEAVTNPYCNDLVKSCPELFDVTEFDMLFFILQMV